MKNEELLKLRITYYLMSHASLVQIQDVLAYIDSPAFLKEVKNAREVLKIKEVPYAEYDKLYAMYRNKDSLGMGMSPESFSKLKQTKHKIICQIISENRGWNIILNEWFKRNPNKKQKLEGITNKILKRFEQNYTKKKITQQAILLGFIGYDSQISFRFQGKVDFPDPTDVLIVDYRTTYKEVKQALKFLKGRYYQPRKDSKGNIWKFKPQSYYPKIMDYHSWYWKRVAGLTYPEILNWWAGILRPEVDYDKLYKSYVREFSEYKDYKIKNKEKYIASWEKEFASKPIPDESEIIKGVKKYEKLLLK